MFARATPEEVLVEEVYTYEQRISRNPSVHAVRPSTGRIGIRLPYDGDRHFTQTAAEDVGPHLDKLTNSSDRLEATIGHLVVVDYEDTNLSEVLALDGTFGAFPIRVPVRSPILGDKHALVADCDEYRVEIDYTPSEDRPKLIPINLAVELADPDHYDLTPVSTARLKRMSKQRAKDHVTRVADSIKRFVGFKPFLRLEVQVTMALPPRKGPDPDPPVVRRVGVKIPTVTTLADSSLFLRVGPDDRIVQHNPKNSQLEWFDVTTRRRFEEPGEDRLRLFDSPEMAVVFRQPGELFAQRRLELEIDVEVPDELLSGTRVRLFDACGMAYHRAPLRVRSLVRTRCTVVLHDAFTKRAVSPYQSFHFDEIIPSPLRIADVKAALEDQRFEIVDEWQLTERREKPPQTTEAGRGEEPQKAAKPAKSSEPRRLRQFIVAERTNGPNTMELWVLVEGRRRGTQREARQPSGYRYTSKFESGDMNIFVRGQIRGDARNLVHEINQLQLALRDRFRRLKAHR